MRAVLDSMRAVGGGLIVNSQYGIRVNSIHPGAVATPLLMGDGLTEEVFLERGELLVDGGWTIG